MTKEKFTKYKQVILSIAMLLLGLLFGFLLKSFCPAEACNFIDTNIYGS